jgi:hypothetical protein
LIRRVVEQPAANREEIAARATYVGSPEHKDIPSFAGHPRPRADASICTRTLASDQETVTSWLRQALLAGNHSEFMDGDFPRYVWHHDATADLSYEARLVNREQGSYKGYPLNPGEGPINLREVQ